MPMKLGNGSDRAHGSSGGLCAAAPHHLRTHGYGRAEAIVSLMITIADGILGALPHETTFNHIERNLRPRLPWVLKTDTFSPRDDITILIITNLCRPAVQDGYVFRCETLQRQRNIVYRRIG